jgi:hypothetical protein
LRPASNELSPPAAKVNKLFLSSWEAQAGQNKKRPPLSVFVKLRRDRPKAPWCFPDLIFPVAHAFGGVGSGVGSGVPFPRVMSGWEDAQPEFGANRRVDRVGRRIFQITLSGKSSIFSHFFAFFDARTSFPLNFPPFPSVSPLSRIVGKRSRVVGKHSRVAGKHSRPGGQRNCFCFKQWLFSRQWNCAIFAISSPPPRRKMFPGPR